MPEQTKLDVNFFKPFVDGTIHTLEVQCQIKSKPQKPFYKGQQPQEKYDIAGVIGLTSQTFTGSITLCFPGKVFLHIMSKMLGENYTEITRDLEDGAAELLNIIFGQAKAVLNDKGYAIEKAIPTVIKGNNIETVHLTANPVIVLPFETEAGIFHIEIGAEGQSM